MLVLPDLVQDGQHAQAVELLCETLQADSQLTAPVLWERSMRALLDGGYEVGLAVGPGRVTAALLKGIKRRAKVHVVGA